MKWFLQGALWEEEITKLFFQFQDARYTLLGIKLIEHYGSVSVDKKMSSF